MNEVVLYVNVPGGKMIVNLLSIFRLMLLSFGSNNTLIWSLDKSAIFLILQIFVSKIYSFFKNWFSDGYWVNWML